MSDDRRFDRAIDDWLAEGSDWTPRSTLDAVLLAVKTTPQERARWVPWRIPTMTTPLRYVVATALVVAVGAAAFAFFGRVPGGVGGPAITPSAAPATPSPAAASATPSPVPAASPTGLPSPTPAPLDTSGWLPSTSTRYGFTISHPDDWEPSSPERAWALPDDAMFPNPATEHFTWSRAADGQGVGVSAWSVAVEPGTTVEAWLEAYCAANPRCGRPPSAGSAVTMDGHPGTLYVVGSFPHAVFLVDDRIYVVACWRSNDDGAVAAFGGSVRLVEAFVSTMRLADGADATPSP